MLIYTLSNMYQKMKSLTYGRTAYVRTNQSFKQLTWPLIDGSITAPNIRLADGSTRSYMTSAAALTCVISTFVNRRNRQLTFGYSSRQPELEIGLQAETP